jgi:ribosomal protein L11 methyltransferase
MREVVLRMAAESCDDALDRLLVIAPDGVRHSRLPGGLTELRLRGNALPPTDAIRQALADLPHRVAERQVPDDWRRRRLIDYRPELIGGRLVVRPDWAPRAPAGAIDLVLEESAAFGAGAHPTTRACLELLLAHEPQGAFLDLGSGSGVLAILAAQLGAGPVSAYDNQPSSVAAAARNAAANRVSITTRVADLRREAPPAAESFVANIPGAVHVAIARRWERAGAPGRGIISGIGPHQLGIVTAAYAAAGLEAQAPRVIHGWAVCELIKAPR